MKPWEHMVKPMGFTLLDGSFRLGSHSDIYSDGIRIELTESYDGFKNKRGVKLGHESQSLIYVSQREAKLLSEFFQLLSETL